MPEPTVLVTDLAFGVLLGCVFAVIAHGLNLIWGVAKIVNVAHGVFIMLGAYGAYFLNLYLGINPLLSAPVDAAIGLAVGAGFYFGFLHRELRGKESIGQQSEMVTLVARLGSRCSSVTSPSGSGPATSSGSRGARDPSASDFSSCPSERSTWQSRPSRSSPSRTSSSAARTWETPSGRIARISRRRSLWESTRRSSPRSARPSDSPSRWRAEPSSLCGCRWGSIREWAPSTPRSAS